MSYIADAPISAKLGHVNIFSDVEFDDTKTLLARENFGLFRREIRPNMIWGWWTQEVAWQLQRFYNEMVEGKRPKLAISSPPQHGKSWAATDFIAYVAGKQPDRKTIFGSYSDDLGVRVPTTICSASSRANRSRGYFPTPRYRKMPPQAAMIDGNATAA
jgi:hypothetical protein